MFPALGTKEGISFGVLFPEQSMNQFLIAITNPSVFP